MQNAQVHTKPDVSESVIQWLASDIYQPTFQFVQSV